MKMTRRRSGADPRHPDRLRDLVACCRSSGPSLTSFKPESKIFTTEIELIDAAVRSRTTSDSPDPRRLPASGRSTRCSCRSLTTSSGSSCRRPAPTRISRFRFRGRSASLYVFLVAQMFPGIILLVPLFTIFTNLGLIDTPWALVLSYSTFAIPFCILMLKGYFDTIPYDLEEAGRVDGLGVFGTFWRIVIPLSVPGLAVTAFYAFITAWNEFLFARAFLTSRDALTLPVGHVDVHRPVQLSRGAC